MASEPIDILKVASRLRDQAWQRVKGAELLNASPAASDIYDSAKMDWLIANEDFNQVEYLAMALRAYE